MVMDLFDCDLESFCERATFLTYERATQLSLQFIKAVRYLGDKLVAHRDIKPNNVFVSESTLHLALGDYGMSSSLVLSFSLSEALWEGDCEFRRRDDELGMCNGSID